ncbi:MAG TPA: hypothetical protein VHL09_15200, partial [Dehalococcoidia bacterium]|nr:hypothetical protein [Dehalococcoidia bacterium]
MPLLPALAFLVTACHVGSGPGTKAAATATAMARATIVAGPDIREVIEVEDPVPFGEQQAAVTVANTGERRVTFTLTVHFTTGGRT